MVGYTIFKTPISTDYKFRDFDANKFQMIDYVPVYAGEFEFNGNSSLEKLFIKFNAEDEMPKDYHSSSMSTSDVIMVTDENNNHRFFYVQMIGFSEITDYVRRNLK